jgi:hypothetical protein
MNVRIPLAQLPRKLAQQNNGPAPSYRACYLAIVDGRLPAEQSDNGRWTVAEDDLAAIAATLCGTPAVKVAQTAEALRE